MDFVVDLVIQAAVQIVIEILGQLLLETAFRGIVGVLRSRVGRHVLAGVVGLAFGIAWGRHLVNEPNPPKLLWVSIASAAGALWLFLRRRHALGVVAPTGSPWREIVWLPWSWGADRALGFVVINVAIAVGIALGYGLTP